MIHYFTGFLHPLSYDYATVKQTPYSSWIDGAFLKELPALTERCVEKMRASLLSLACVVYRESTS